MSRLIALAAPKELHDQGKREEMIKRMTRQIERVQSRKVLESNLDAIDLYCQRRKKKSLLQNQTTYGSPQRQKTKKVARRKDSLLSGRSDLSKKSQKQSSLDIRQFDAPLNFDSVGANWKALNGEKEEIEKVLGKTEGASAARSIKNCAENLNSSTRRDLKDAPALDDEAYQQYNGYTDKPN